MGDMRIQAPVMRQVKGPIPANRGCAGNFQIPVTVGKIKVFVTQQGLQAMKASYGPRLVPHEDGYTFVESERFKPRAMRNPDALDTIAANPRHKAVLKPSSVLERNDLHSGAEAYNLRELNSWIAHHNELDTRFRTGQETRLVQAIKDRVEADPQGRRLSLDDVVSISAALNKGDMTRTLLTVHNAFRSLARGADFPKHEFPELAEDRAFFKKYLDSGSIGLKDSHHDLSGDWYHVFTSATITFVGLQKGGVDALKELYSAEGTHMEADFTYVASRFVPFAGSLTAYLNLVGEQVGCTAKDSWQQKRLIGPDFGEMRVGNIGIDLAGRLSRQL